MDPEKLAKLQQLVQEQNQKQQQEEACRKAHLKALLESDQDAKLFSFLPALSGASTDHAHSTYEPIVERILSHRGITSSLYSIPSPSPPVTKIVRYSSLTKEQKASHIVLLLHHRLKSWRR
jgi:hypothetical protein